MLRPALSTLVLAVVLALAFQGSRGIWEPDEGRYVAVAVEMLRTGDWLTPRLNHEVLHLAKPPLAYWSIAGAIRLLGPSEWAARLPNVLAFLATVLLVGRLGRRLAAGRGDLAALVYATSLMPFVATNIVTTDTLLAAATTLGLWAFVENWFAAGTPLDTARRRLCLDLVLGLGFGLAFLTKGPPGLLPLFGLLVFALVERGPRGLARVFSPPAAVVLAAVALPWYALEIVLRPEALDYWIGGEVVGRLGGAHGRNAGLLGGFLEAYLPVLVLGLQPWTIPVAIAAWRRRVGSGSLADGAAEPGPAARLVPRLVARLTPPVPETRLLAAVTLVPLLVFLFSRSRLPLYLLPLAAPAAVAAARALGDLRLGRKARVALAAWCLALVGLKAVAAARENPRDVRLAARVIARQLLPATPAEILFVDEKPMWGLTFYLPTEVEWIRLSSAVPGELAPSFQPLYDLIDEEIAERETNLALLVRPSREHQTVDRFRAAGWSVAPRGEVADRVLYWLEPPSPTVPAAGTAE